MTTPTRPSIAPRCGDCQHVESRHVREGEEGLYKSRSRICLVVECQCRAFVAPVQEGA